MSEICQNIENKNVVSNVKKFINNNLDELQKHYYELIDKNSGERKLKIDNNIYVDIGVDEYKNNLISVSIVILTANFFESEILNYNVFKDTNEKILRLDKGINIFNNINFKVVDAFIMNYGGYKILHLHAPETGANTPCGSADLARYVTSNTFINPECIISFGICYGINPTKFNLGDTIIASKIYPCTLGLKINEHGWSIKHDDYIINLEENYNQMYHDIKMVIEGQKNIEKNIVFTEAKLGNMLTGEAVVSNEKYKIDAIEKAYGCNIIGGEMEGYGLAKECIYYSKTSCLIIKAICDWGACKNIDSYLEENIKEQVNGDLKDKLQAYAAYCAWTVLRKLLVEKIFKNDNIYSKFKNMIINRYCADLYIKKKVLINFLGKGNIEKIIFSSETISNENKNSIITLCFLKLLDERILIKTVNGNIEGYRFNVGGE